MTLIAEEQPGLQTKRRLWKPVEEQFRIHKERPFLKEERATTTVLVGGLSPMHDYLVEATLKGLGLKALTLPPTNIAAFHTGREYGNNGFCNPAYFMVGNLINYLRELERSGMSKDEIIEKYVFFTAGCNAPCRFGMLDTEYRMALEDCGFGGFRILVFQNEGGLKQASSGDGLEINPEFFLAAVNALNLADILNELGYAIRPYEVVPGETDKLIQQAADILYQKLANKKEIRIEGFWKGVFDRLNLLGAATFIYRFWDHITTTYYTDALQEVRSVFSEMEVDWFRSKPVVKITGEFWAMTTVGDGNFKMFRYLENEGAVILVEPVASLVQFLFSKGLLRHSNRREMILKNNVRGWWDLRRRYRNWLQYQKKRLTLKVGYRLYRREYKRLLDALGGNHHMLIQQPILQKLAHPYFNINIEGGEGYMEIAKNIYYHQQAWAHMVMSLKPFGCMPSTQSDGAQAAVQERDPNMIFLPLETAGEGETNAQSRVLMSLGDARAKAKQEYKDALREVGFTLEEMRNFVDAHPELKSPLYVIPHTKKVANTAARFIYDVGQRMEQTRSDHP
ncbi:MAG: activator of (R)-2-hydroxyglutaryl-CoA dehydratase [Bacteroidetes bacterium]|nr:MAG: activator of (R)-2-hydroxyglutaryl-CoA dehydratase [Bacteroidota bacterium]